MTRTRETRKDRWREKRELRRRARARARARRAAARRRRGRRSSLAPVLPRRAPPPLALALAPLLLAEQRLPRTRASRARQQHPPPHLGSDHSGPISRQVVLSSIANKDSRVSVTQGRRNRLVHHQAHAQSQTRPGAPTSASRRWCLVYARPCCGQEASAQDRGALSLTRVESVDCVKDVIMPKLTIFSSLFLQSSSLESN